jgi:hypothetical protein
MNCGSLLEFIEIAARLDCPEHRYGEAGLGFCGSQEVRNGVSILTAKVQFHSEHMRAVRIEIRRLVDHARPRCDARLEVPGNDAAHASSELVRGFPWTFAPRGDARDARGDASVVRSYHCRQTPGIVDEVIRSRHDQARSGRVVRRDDAMACRMVQPTSLRPIAFH